MNNFKARQTECVHGKGMPGKYVMVEMWDQYAGLGNQFPSMITGMNTHKSRTGGSLPTQDMVHMKTGSCMHRPSMQT